MYYLVNGYRFIHPEKWMQLTAKHLKRKFLRLRHKITQKSASKDFIKTSAYFLFIFSQKFLQHFWNRPYPNVKIVLAYFCIIKTILIIEPRWVLDAFLTLLRVLLALNLSRSLDFSNESPCLYPKSRILFFNKRCFFTISYVIYN